MSPQPIAVDILSDGDSDDGGFNPSSPSQSKKKQRTDSNNHPNPTLVFIIDDDPTPIKKTPAAGPSSSSSSVPLLVAETPMSDLPKSHGPVIRCSRGGVSEAIDPTKPSGINGLICLESDNESEADFHSVSWKPSETCFAAIDVTKSLEFSPICIDSPLLCGNTEKGQLCEDKPWHKILQGDNSEQPDDHPMEEADRVQQTGNILGPKNRNKYDPNEILNMDESRGKKRTTKEEKVRLMEEKKQKKELEKLQKAALKAEADEMKKLQKVKQKWETGKLALKSIVAEIDTKVIELGTVGGHLLTRFSEKGLTYRITSNPIERSIVWSMNVPEDISEVCPKGFEIPYVLLIHEAGEFCNLLTNEALMDHLSRVRRQYPSHTVCYLTNRLMAHINKREQGQYKDPANHSGWRRPPVEEVLSKLTSHFVGVHSRLCIDEAELAEHVVGLTCSLASCQFRKKLTRLSVNANGSLIPKDCIDKNLIKKSVWLKALVAIPKVQPRFAIAIWKKYPTMKSLLSVYMDPSKSVHEKEFLLEDLTTEGLLGENRRLGEVCSKRVYRILMAQSGSIKTDDVENGADFFQGQSS